MNYHRAPWCPLLWTMSILATALCAGVAAVLLYHDPGSPVARTIALAVLAIPLGALPFVVRGYSVQPDAILVQRLWWQTHISLAGLRSAYPGENVVRGSIRVFGNGGLFSFTGRYWNRRLGSYRALVTDPRKTVVLEFVDRKLVISPEDPAAFLRAIGK